MLQTLLPVNIFNSTLSAARCFCSTDYCPPYGRHIQPLVRLGANERWVMGVTQLYDEIYVVCHESPSILVYNAQVPFSRLDNVVVKEMKRPLDIVAFWLVTNGLGDAALHCIYELTADGHILDKYGGQPGSRDGQLNRSWYLELSDDGKQILVTDYDNRRVLILDRQPMRLKRVLLETGGKPFRLFFVRLTDVTRLLIVAGQSVLVHGLK